MAPVSAVSRVNIKARLMFNTSFSLVCPQYGKECLLRYFHGTNLLHTTFARFLLFQQFPLARYVTAVTFGGHVLPERLDGAACDDLATDRRLDRNVEHLAGNKFAHPFDQVPSPGIGRGSMYDHRQRIYTLLVYKDVEPHQRRWLETLEGIVEGSKASANGLETVEEIQHDFRQRHLVHQ